MSNISMKIYYNLMYDMISHRRWGIMNKIEELLIKIDELRKIMCNLIDEQSNLLDPKVVQASQNLDEALNFYHELLKSKERK